MYIPETIAAPLQVLGKTDRNLIAAALSDSDHLVEDSMGENPLHRHEAYKALAKLIMLFEGVNAS